MKTKKIFLSIILLLLLGCTNNGDLSEGDNSTNQETPPTYPVEIQATDFALPEGCTWKSHTERENVYVMCSVEDILPYINGEFPKNSIDFAKYSLIYARGMGNSGIDNITKQLQQISENEYLLYVEITNNMTEIAPLWNIAILLPVIPQNAEVRLNVNPFPKYITPVQIAQGELHGAGEEGFSQQGIAIKTDSEWEAFKQKINTTNNVVDTYFTEKEIDFKDYQIIAVFDEVKGNGGWSIDITGITEWQDKMLISVTNLKSGKEGGYAVMNQPFQIVKIPVAEKEIEFGFDLAGKGDDNPDIALAGTKWKVKSQNMSGESVNIISPPEDALYPDISIQIPDTIKGSIIGNTFYNYIWINFEIKDNQQILFENYGGSRIAEDDWGRAFSDNLRNTVKFVFSNNELTFLDLQDKPTVVFTHK